MDIEEALRKCSKIINKDGPMELDTSTAFVFQNAVIVFSMQLTADEGRHLHVDIFAGELEVFNEKIDGLLEED